jgi:hypothetical protein
MLIMGCCLIYLLLDITSQQSESPSLSSTVVIRRSSALPGLHSPRLSLQSRYSRCLEISRRNSGTLLARACVCVYIMENNSCDSLDFSAHLVRMYLLVWLHTHIYMYVYINHLKLMMICFAHLWKGCLLVLVLNFHFV